MLEQKGQMTNSPNKCDVAGGHPVQFALIVGVYPASPTKGLIRASSSSSSRARHVPVFGLIGYLPFSRRHRLPIAKRQTDTAGHRMHHTHKQQLTIVVSIFVLGGYLSIPFDGHQQSPIRRQA